MSCCSQGIWVVHSIEGLFLIKRNSYLRDFSRYQFEGVGVSGARNSGKLDVYSEWIIG